MQVIGLILDSWSIRFDATKFNTAIHLTLHTSTPSFFHHCKHTQLPHSVIPSSPNTAKSPTLFHPPHFVSVSSLPTATLTNSENWHTGPLLQRRPLLTLCSRPCWSVWSHRRLPPARQQPSHCQGGQGRPMSPVGKQEVTYCCLLVSLWSLFVMAQRHG